MSGNHQAVSLRRSFWRTATCKDTKDSNHSKHSTWSHEGSTELH